MNTKNVMIVGVGGQGSLLASKMLGHLLVEQGYDVKVSEVHGMSQRGGSVVTYVRFGDKVYSPIVDKGEADFIVSFELLEAARYTEDLKPGGKIITSTHQTVYVVTPEHTTGSQLLFRDNIAAMIQGKHVLILAASVTTGYTAQAAVEALNYYGGHVAGICALFATTDTCAGFPVRSVFDATDLDGYISYPSHTCPLCKKGERIDALVNSFGYSKL